MVGGLCWQISSSPYTLWVVSRMHAQWKTKKICMIFFLVSHIFFFLRRWFLSPLFIIPLLIHCKSLFHATLLFLSFIFIIFTHTHEPSSTPTPPPPTTNLIQHYSSIYLFAIYSIFPVMSSLFVAWDLFEGVQVAHWQGRHFWVSRLDNDKKIKYKKWTIIKKKRNEKETTTKKDNLSLVVSLHISPSTRVLATLPVHAS